jgi:hypothetical protein
LPAQAHQPFDSLRWSHPTNSIFTATKTQRFAIRNEHPATAVTVRYWLFFP